MDQSGCRTTDITNVMNCYQNFYMMYDSGGHHIGHTSQMYLITGCLAYLSVISQRYEIVIVSIRKYNLLHINRTLGIQENKPAARQVIQLIVSTTEDCCMFTRQQIRLSLASGPLVTLSLTG